MTAGSNRGQGAQGGDGLYTTVLYRGTEGYKPVTSNASLKQPLGREGGERRVRMGGEGRGGGRVGIGANDIFLPCSQEMST